ncbi:MAG TPA: dihydrolipoamide acetyltransferase family protein, partial [Gemmatimonadales bacterium]|nr:dihydrolipoamide acetyltransferase family protein [Gemmatimonadales bacterium]
MATKVVMEALSPTMEEGRLVEWKKNEGDTVAQGDVLAEVETDKAVMELVARAAGTLIKQVVAAGETVPVSEVVGWIGEAGEEVEGGGEKADKADKADRADEADEADKAEKADETDGADKAEKTDEADKTDQTDKAEKTEKTDKADKAGGRAGGQADGADKPTAPSGGRVKASPLARKMAAEQGLDLAEVSGSGPEGRIIKRDLDGIKAGAAKPAAAAAAAKAAGDDAEAYEDLPVSQMRKAIAKRLVQSIGPIPTFYLTTEVDMERAWDARAALNAAAGDEGKVSFNDIIIKATAMALHQHPECNAWWQDGTIRQWNEVHMGMAVAIPDGLITPVIRHADRKSLRQISAESRDLAKRARDRKLQPEEYTGATFTISNLGMLDIHEFTAIINPPEAGILAVGRIAEVPAVVDGVIDSRRRMMLTMSCDHRVIDGATGATFLKTL